MTFSCWMRRVFDITLKFWNKTWIFLDIFDHDLNNLSRIEYEERNEINHVQHVYLFKTVLVSWLIAVAQTNERRTEFVFPWLFFGSEFNCGLFANFTSESKLDIADGMFPVFPLLVWKVLIFNINRLLNDDSHEAGEILGVLLEEMLYLKFKNVETVLLSLPHDFIPTALITMMQTSMKMTLLFPRTDKYWTNKIS